MKLSKVFSVFSASLLLLSALVVFNPAPSYACSCLASGTPTEELAKWDVVFSGLVDSVELSSGSYQNRVTFDVETSWKGVSQKKLEVSTEVDSAACGFNFEKGKKYIVYASDTNGDTRLKTGLCSRTALLEDASNDVKELGTGTKIGRPGAPVTTEESYPYILIGLAAIILLGVYLASRIPEKSVKSKKVAKTTQKSTKKAGKKGRRK